MKIDELVEEAYNIFSKYKITPSLDVCKPCCISEEQEKKLTGTPLRELDAQIIEDYITSAGCGTIKEKHEMCYFLPKILELISKNIFPCMCTSTLLRKLFDEDNSYGCTKAEYDFIGNFFYEYWVKYINNYSSDNERITEIILLIGRNFDINPCLKQWQLSKLKDSVRYFADLIIDTDFDTLGTYSNEKLDQQIWDWLASKETQEIFTPRIEDLYFNGELNTIDNLYIESTYVLYTTFCKNINSK